MWDTFSKLRNLLDRREQRRALLLLAMIIVTAMAAISSFGQQVGTMFGTVDTEMQNHGIK